MARTWLSISVELLGGRGEDLWPHPGRIFAVGPSHTFENLADAINTAFARWDRAHLSEFTLANGTPVTNLQYVDELANSLHGPIFLPADSTTTKVARTVAPGDEFQFVFDLGDFWVHRCTVEAQKVDPMEVLGIRPKGPLAYWGWGNMPDQYGRRWADDDGERRAPRRPTQPDPMQHHIWPPHDQLPDVDLAEVHSAVREDDASRFMDAIIGVNIDDALDEIAGHASLLLETRTEEREAVVLTLLNRLTWRSRPGDRELADRLLASLRGA